MPDMFFGFGDSVSQTWGSLIQLDCLAREPHLGFKIILKSRFKGPHRVTGHIPLGGVPSQWNPTLARGQMLT